MPLLIFRGFLYDPHSILAAVHQPTLVGIELCRNIWLRIKQVRLELRIAAFTDADSRGSTFYDSELALGHVRSLAHGEGRASPCGNQTAPLPTPHALTASNGSDDNKGLHSRGDRVGEGGVGRLMG